MEPNTPETQEKPRLPQQETVPLTDGRDAVVRRGKGRLSVQANKMVSSPAELPLAMASLMTTIDGKPLVYEDLLDMDLADTLNIQSAAMRLAGNATQTNA